MVRWAPLGGMRGDKRWQEGNFYGRLQDITQDIGGRNTVNGVVMGYSKHNVVVMVVN